MDLNVAQGAQCGLIKESALNHIINPTEIFGILLNETILGSLGWGS